MDTLPFELLKDPLSFQRLCADVLIAAGCKNARGFGAGADQGNDFLIDVPMASALGEDLQPYLVQCKWYSPGNHVGEKEIGDAIGYIELHGAEGLLIITSSQFTGTAITKMNAIDRSSRHMYQIRYWDGTELTKRLRRHPDIIAGYWYGATSNKNTKHDNDQLPKYDAEQMLDAHPTFASELALLVDTFPSIPENISAVSQLKDLAQQFELHAPVLTLLEGVIGAGKTGVACALLNILRGQGLKAVILTASHYQELVFEYFMSGDLRIPQYLKFWQDVDALAFDDFGLYLRDKSDTQVQAAELLVRIVETRIKAKKPTLIVIPGEMEYGPTIKNYLDFLKATYTVWHGGNVSLRPYIRVEKGEAAAREEVTDPINNDATIFTILGKSWIVEKYGMIEHEIADIIQLLLMPEERYQGLAWRLKERYGYTVTRTDEVVDRLRHVIERTTGYRGFIETLDFQALLFYSDGNIEIRKRNN